VILPLQRLFDKHLLLDKDKVAPSAITKEVVASKRLYTKANLYFATPITLRKLKLKLLTRALYIKTAVAVDIISKS
jgi:hypothetical protein